MNSFATRSRRALIRFGKVCPFVICFVVLVSDIENIVAILRHDVVLYGDTLIYNTPVSFAIGSQMEYDIFAVAVVALISFSIEACIYNILAVCYLGVLLLRKSFFAYSAAMSDGVYLAIMSACAAILAYFVIKGVKILVSG